MRLFSLKRVASKNFSRKIDTRNHSTNSTLFNVIRILLHFEKIARRRSCFKKNWICLSYAYRLPHPSKLASFLCNKIFDERTLHENRGTTGTDCTIFRRAIRTRRAARFRVTTGISMGIVIYRRVTRLTVHPCTLSMVYQPTYLPTYVPIYRSFS